mgnify:CR=1 FL=1
MAAGFQRKGTKMNKFIAIMGNPVDGFYYVGPFDLYDDARHYVETEWDRRDWWVAELQLPASEETDALAFVEGTEAN